jgi:hypothetical protein
MAGVYWILPVTAFLILQILGFDMIGTGAIPIAAFQIIKQALHRDTRSSKHGYPMHRFGVPGNNSHMSIVPEIMRREHYTILACFDRSDLKAVTDGILDRFLWSRLVLRVGLISCDLW